MYSARLAASDGVNTSLSAPLSIIAGNLPVVTIESPANGTTFRAGDIISFSGAATDAEDGPLPVSGLNWNLVFHHGTHIHPVFGPWSKTNRGELLIPSAGHVFGFDTSYELMLIATDSTGLQASDSVTIQPDLVGLSFGTVPSGLTIKVDGISRVTPFTNGTLIGFQHSVEAPNQIVAGSNHVFQSWTDGGTQSHSFVVPSQNLTLSAAFRNAASGTLFIESAMIQGNSFRLRFNSETGRTYRVERSPTMEPDSWEIVADQVPGTGALIEIVNATNNPAIHGFYRVELLQSGSLGPPGFATAAEAHNLDVATLSTMLSSPGGNRVLLVGLCWNDDTEDSITSVTFAGVACTQLSTTNWFYGTGRLALYGLLAPPTGNHLLEVTMSGNASELAMAGMIFTNANQIASFGPADPQFAAGPMTDISVSVPSSTSDVIVDLLGYYAFVPTAGPGQTERIAAINVGNASLRMSTKPGEPNATFMSWSMSAATEISQIGISIRGR